MSTVKSVSASRLKLITRRVWPGKSTRACTTAAAAAVGNKERECTAATLRARQIEDGWPAARSTAGQGRRRAWEPAAAAASCGPSDGADAAAEVQFRSGNAALLSAALLPPDTVQRRHNFGWPPHVPGCRMIKQVPAAAAPCCACLSRPLLHNLLHAASSLQPSCSACRRVCCRRHCCHRRRLSSRGGCTARPGRSKACYM